MQPNRHDTDSAHDIMISPAYTMEWRYFVTILNQNVSANPIFLFNLNKFSLRVIFETVQYEISHGNEQLQTPESGNLMVFPGPMSVSNLYLTNVTWDAKTLSNTDDFHLFKSEYQGWILINRFLSGWVKIAEL